MSLLYILEGLALTIVAADSGAIQGRLASELGLPFAMIAERIWVTVPVLFLVVSIPRFRKQLGRWQHLIHVAAVGCIILPILIFFSHTNQIPLNDFPSVDASKAIKEQLHGHVVFVGGGGGTRAYLPNTLDKDEVAQAIFALDPNSKPTNTEQGAASKP